MANQVLSGEILDLLCCSDCSGKLIRDNISLKCALCSRVFEIVDGIPNLISKIIDPEVEYSIARFDQIYSQTNDDYEKLINHFKTNYVFGSQKDLENLPDKKGGRFLELGCGGGYSGVVMQKKGYQVFGIDYSQGGIVLSEKVNKAFGVEEFLVRADILHQPFVSGSFDVVFGGGTIEHLENTQKAVDEIFRVTKSSGVSINTVPVISISSLTYRQLSANIPDLPILKQIFSYVHQKLLKGKFMHTGYEKSFLSRDLWRMHRNSGFSIIKVEKYNFVPELADFPKWSRKFLRWLEKFRLFWTAVTVTALKK